jgi:hypothetical protein
VAVTPQEERRLYDKAMEDKLIEEAPEDFLDFFRGIGIGIVITLTLAIVLYFLFA